MSRIRSIHPGIFTDEAFVSVSPWARLLLFGVWGEAWDDGVFEWKPTTLKMRLFPADNVDVAALLDELVAADILKCVELKGRQYGAIRNFQRFQRPKKPNSSGVMTEQLRTYVGSPGASSEPVPNQLPTGTEKPNQMEDGGWRMEEGGEKKESAPQPLSAGGAEIDFNQVEHACRMALGDKAPADLVIGPMVALLRAGHPLQRVTDYLRSEARRERRRPILTWKLWAELYGRDAAGAAAIPTAAPSKPFAMDDERWGNLLFRYRKTGVWPQNALIGPAPGEPGCKVPPHLLEAAA